MTLDCIRLFLPFLLHIVILASVTVKWPCVQFTLSFLAPCFAFSVFSLMLRCLFSSGGEKARATAERDYCVCLGLCVCVCDSPDGPAISIKSLVKECALTCLTFPALYLPQACSVLSAFTKLKTATLCGRVKICSWFFHLLAHQLIG